MTSLSSYRSLVTLSEVEGSQSAGWRNKETVRNTLRFFDSAQNDRDII